MPITIDTREPEPYRSALTQLLEQATLAALPAGDYTWTGHNGVRVLVERKTIGDLLGSIKDGRWQRQLPALVEADLPVLLLEGRWCVEEGHVKLGRHVTPWRFEELDGVLLSAQMLGIHLARSEAGAEAMALRLVALHRQTVRDEHPGLMPRRRSLGRTPEEQVALGMLSQLPGVGERTARRLLARHGSLWAALGAIIDGSCQEAGLARWRRSLGLSPAT